MVKEDKINKSALSPGDLGQQGRHFGKRLCVKSLIFEEYSLKHLLMAVQMTKRLLTVEEYHKMGEAGILQEKGIELINGEIIQISPIGSKHAAVVNLLNEILFEKLGKNAIISVQNPVRLSDLSEPEPDIAILKRKEGRYFNHLPKAMDTLLVIEIADTSLAYDREIKLPLYAEGGIPECWLVNLEDNVIEVHWQPAGNAYKFRELLRAGDVVKARNLDLSIPVKEVFL